MRKEAFPRRICGYELLQGLKPDIGLIGFIGPAKAVPLLQSTSKASFSAACKARTLSLCPIPPIEQRTLDGWGTVSSSVGLLASAFAGGEAKGYGDGEAAAGHGRRCVGAADGRGTSGVELVSERGAGNG
jgi:hypothetical protein